MICYRQTVGIYKMCILHTKFCCSLIHSLHKNLLAACHIFGQSHTAVIGACHSHSLHKLGYGVSFSRFHVHLASSHGGSSFGDGHSILQGDFARVNCIHNKEHGHYLGDRGQRQFLVGVLLKEHLSRFRIYKHRPLGCNIKGRFRSFVL